MKQQKVLIFDIETAPMVAYVWGRRDVNISLNQIKSDWYILAFAAKWLGDPPSKILYHDQRHEKDLSNDKQLLLQIWGLLDQADIVITHNGKRFDSRKINARFILNGIKPPSPYRHYDTLTLVRRIADFTSNSLEYLTDKLCTKYKKLKHDKFPGMALWTACLAGNKDAWAEMQKYNIHDVLSLEEFYLKTRAWASPSMPALFRVSDDCNECPTCGAVGALQPRGYFHTNLTKTRRFRCKKCGAWIQGKREKR